MTDEEAILKYFGEGVSAEQTLMLILAAGALEGIGKVCRGILDGSIDYGYTDDE